jgi:hypothetical protein
MLHFIKSGGFTQEGVPDCHKIQKTFTSVFRRACPPEFTVPLLLSRTTPPASVPSRRSSPAHTLPGRQKNFISFFQFSFKVPGL